jgi:hypothetical protein
VETEICIYVNICLEVAEFYISVACDVQNEILTVQQTHLFSDQNQAPQQT